MTCENAIKDIKKNVGGATPMQRIRNVAKKRVISPESASEIGRIDGCHNIPKQPMETPPHFVKLVSAFSDEMNHKTVQAWSKADAPLYEELVQHAEDESRFSIRFEKAKVELHEAKEEHGICQNIKKKLSSIYTIGALGYYLPLILLSAPEAVLSYLTLQGISDNTYVLYALAGFMAVIFGFCGHKLGIFARMPFSRRNVITMVALVVMPIMLVVVAAEIRSKAVLESSLVTDFWHGNPPSFMQFLILFLSINGLIMLIAFALSCCYRRHIPEIREADSNLKLAKEQLDKAQREFNEVYSALAAARKSYRRIRARREKLAQIWTEKCKETCDWAIGIVAVYAAANTLSRTDGEEIEFDEGLIPTIDIQAYAAEVGREFETFPDLDEFPNEECGLAAVA